MNPLIIVSGLAGVGKSTVARRIAKELDAEVIDSDDLRGKKENIKYTQAGYQNSGEVRASVNQNYKLLFEKARESLAKKPVILCATFSREDLRDEAKKIAKELGIPFFIVSVVCKDEELLKKRLTARREKNPGAAGFEIYTGLKKDFEKIDEKDIDFVFDSTDEENFDKNVKEVADKIKADSLKIGYPDNPIAESKRLFPDIFFVSCYSSLKDVKEQGFNLIELHMQTFNELKDKEKLKEYAAEARKSGFYLIMHVPFMEIEGEKFNHVLPLKIKALPDAKEATQSELEESITVCSDLGISFLTIHASSAIKFMTEDEFKLFLEHIKKLNDFAKSKNVTLCVETGGLTEKQLESLIENGLYITLDTAHLVLDILDQEKDLEKANKSVIEFFKKNKEKIPIIHMTQTKQDKDAHMDIDEEGIVLINRELFDHIDHVFNHVMFEFKPTRDKSMLIKQLRHIKCV